MNKNIRLEIPENAKIVIDTIVAAGYEAYVVGGCVRDSILGRDPHDWDITTSATPMQVKALFKRTIDTGLQHGTVTVMIDKEGYEVTTYRIDGEYEDGRHPKEVVFTPNLEEDLKRRDFTINAMAYNDTEGIVDLFGGLQDIENKVIRCVGDPMARFGEDALRILRAIRFSAQLDYKIDEQTRQAIQALAPTLKKISAERIQAELVKMMVSAHPDRLRDAYELGVTAQFLPEFDACMQTEQHHKHHIYSVGEHIIHAIMSVPADKELRLAMLFHDIGKPETLSFDEDGTTHFYEHAKRSEEMAEQILKRLKFDNKTIESVKKLVLYHDARFQEPSEKVVRKFINKIGVDAFPAIFEVMLADIMAQSDYERQEKLDFLAKWRSLYEVVMEKEQCISLKDLQVKGADLMAVGMQPGKEMGEVLNALLEKVLDDPSLNNKETLLALVAELRQK